MDLADPNDPTAQAVRDWIELDGGPLVPQALGRSLDNQDFLDALVSIDYLTDALNQSAAANGGPAVSVHLTRSPSMRTAMRLVAPDHAAVLVPVGTLARLQVMHRLLLGYWTQDTQVPSFLASIMDRPFERVLPAALRPRLDDDDATGAGAERRWWAARDTLNDAIVLDEAFAPDVGELNHLALSLLLSHEFAHVARHHPDLRRRVRAGELVFEVGHGSERRPGTDAELRRAMENDADRVAAYLVVLTLVRQVGLTDDLPRGFVRLGYACTALLALFDPRRLSLMTFGVEASYPHPLLRLQAWLADSARCAQGLGLEETFKACAQHGSSKCLDALARLEFDVYAQRRFCAADEKPDPVLHALRGSMTNAFRLARDAAREEALTLRLNTLVTAAHGPFNF